MKRRVLLLAVLGCLAVTAPAMAVPNQYMFGFTTGSLGQVQLLLDGKPVDARDSGWYQDAGNHAQTNNNYIVGVLGDVFYHDYFIFDIPRESRVSSAVLQLWNPGSPLDGYNSPDPTELYLLYDVKTNPVDLDKDVTGETGIYVDLGTGALFGSRIVSAGDNGTFVKIDLNADALQSINDSAGKAWAVGGALDFGNPIPEPTTMLLLGSGLLVGGRLRRRR